MMGVLAHRCALEAHHGSCALAMTLWVHCVLRVECLGMCRMVAVDVEPTWQLPRWWWEVQGVRFQGHQLWRAALSWGRHVTHICSSGMWVTMRWPKQRRRQ